MANLKYLTGATFTLKWSVLYPIDKKTSVLKKIGYYIWAFFYILSFITIIVQCTVHLYIKPFDIIEEATIVMNTVFYTSLFINFIIFYWKSDSLVSFVNKINYNFVDESDNNIEKVSMDPASKLADKMAYFWAISLVITSAMPSLLSLAAGSRSMPIPAWFPYDYEQSPLFEISYIWQVFCLINMGLIYGATDMIYPCITVLMAQQFNILGNNLKNNFFKALLKSGIDQNMVEKFRHFFNNNLETHDLIALTDKYKDIFALLELQKFRRTNLNCLKKNIKHHQMLLNFCENINNILSVFLLVKISAVMFNLIFIAFGLLHTQDHAMILGWSNYFLFATGELLMYTYSGQILTQSADFMWILYESPWFLGDLNYQKIFLMIQRRTTKGVVTRAGMYFAMTAPSFLAFMKAVFSYTAVLKEVTDRGI